MSSKLAQRFNFLVNLFLVAVLLISSFTVTSKPAIAQPPGPTASTLQQSPSAPAAASATAVLLTDSGFSPQVITITAGATVTWTNQTARAHLVKSGQPDSVGTNHLLYLPALFTKQASGGGTSGSSAVSAASNPLNSGVSWSTIAQDDFSTTINPGDTFTHTFATPGETPYYSATDPLLTGKVIVLEAPLPPDPGTTAPPLAPGVTSDISSSTAFLYSGANPIQTGVQPGTIQPDKIAVLRGKVIRTDGSPLVGVRVTVKDHPEFGKTYSRADGLYDLAINGGEVYTLQYTRSGFLPTQRKLEPNWREFGQMPDVALTNFDSRVTAIDLSSAGVQVAQGNPVSDADGSRQGTLLIPPGTQAELVFADGSKQVISTFHVRVSEYTAGEKGPETMPGELPAESGYTYAVEYSLDEALQAGAVNVNFSQALTHYTQNFLHFTVGEAVPTGYYDRLQARWVPGDNGRVVKIISIAGGLANLDTDGDGVADNGSTEKDPLVISNAERQRLAQVFQTGQELWRVPVQHFSPWDCNWPYGPPPDAKPPEVQPSKKPDPKPQEEDKECGSIIGCQSQNLVEKLRIAGTPFELVYNSQRNQPNPNTLKVQLTEATYPSSLASILLVVEVANNRYEQTFSPSPNLVTTFTWDGKDAYGRALQGEQPVTVKVGYVYPAYYYSPGEFGRAFARSGGNITSNRTRMELTLWQTSYQGTIGNLDARIQGLGGWTLSSNHIYTTVGRNLYLGSGEMRSAEAQGFYIINTLYRETVSGDEPYFKSLAMGPDGSVYALDMWKNRLDKITPDGQMTVVAGNGTQGYSGDGGLAVNAQMNWPVGVAIGPDGSILIADGGNHVVRRVSPNGIISTFAGNGGDSNTCESEDGILATQHCLGQTGAVAVAPDGTVYIAASGSIYRVAPDGLIYEIAGHGSLVGEGIPAYDASLSFVYDMTLGPDGTIYLVDGKVFKITPAGLIYSVAGHYDSDFAGDGGPAVDAHLRNPYGLSLGPDGSLYIADSGNNRVRRVRPDGIIETVAGGDWVNDRCDENECPDGSLATLYTLSLPLDVLVGPDGTVYVADHFHAAIRKVVSGLPGYSVGDALIASQDGTQVYRINSSGQHSQTLDALTGAVLFTFTYDAHGALASITDAYGSKTVIERNGSGLLTGILSPYGQRTPLALDSFGFLKSFTNPLGATYTFTYTSGGLLTSLKEPLGGLHTFSYDTKGRLLTDVDPLGAITTLTRIEDAAGYAVTLNVGGAVTTTYSVHKQPNGDILSEVTDGAGLKTTTLRNLSGFETITYPDGSVETLAFAPDPRWGMNAAYLKHYTRTTPAGLILDIIYSRQAVLGSLSNPFDLTTLTDTAVVNYATTTTIYTGSDRTVRTTSPNGWVTSLTLDALGCPVAWQAPGLEAKHYSYDAHGRLASISQGVGVGTRTSTFAFTNSTTGTILHYTDPLGKVTVYAYDLADQVISMTEPDGAVTGYTYDANGNTLTVTPPGRAAHTFTYNAANQVAANLPPGTGAQATTYTYTSDGQLKSITYPARPALSLGYDAAGRMTERTTTRGAETFTYDPAKGFLSAVSAPGGISQSFTYDGNLPTGATLSGPVAGSLAYAYDSNFRLISLVYPGDLTVPFSYNDDDQLTQAGDTYLHYFSSNPLLSELDLNGIQATYSYDAFGELSQVVESYQGTEIYSASYGYDKAGRITNLSETIEGVTAALAFTYDSRGRLLTVKKDGSPYASYSYDANSNRLASTGPGGNASGVYDAEDRLTQYGAASFTYTPDGRLHTRTSGGKTTTYTYDTVDNLAAVNLPDGKPIAYLFDGLQHRIGKKVQGTLVAGFIYDQDRLVAALDGSGNVVSRFIYASRDDVPDEMERGGVLYRIITDQAGSVRLVINTSDGSIAQRIDYDPFGQVLSDSNPGFQPFGFAGGLYDADTNLVRFGVRDFDPLVGRWTAKDPLLFDGNQSNLYVYVNNDPLNRRDPSGFQEDPYPSFTPKNKALAHASEEQKKLAEMNKKNCEEGVKPLTKKIKDVYKRPAKSLQGIEDTTSPAESGDSGSQRGKGKWTPPPYNPKK